MRNLFFLSIVFLSGLMPQSIFAKITVTNKCTQTHTAYLTGHVLGEQMPLCSSGSASLAPGETHDFEISKNDLPECNYQVDLYALDFDTITECDGQSDGAVLEFVEETYLWETHCYCHVKDAW